MQIIDRTNAALLGYVKYFSGTPCKHGHLCERYVVNAGCVQCMTQKSSGTQLPMCEIYIALFPEDIEIFKAVLISTCMLRDPGTLFSDVLTRSKPKYFGRQTIHKFMCFIEDFTELHRISREMEDATHALINQRRAEDAQRDDDIKQLRAAGLVD